MTGTMGHVFVRFMKVIHHRPALVTLLVLIQLLALAGRTHAVTPELSASPAATSQAAATPSADASDPGSFAALGYGDITAQGMYAAVDYFFPIPLGRQTGGGSLDLNYTHSPLLVPDRSTMTVIVNGKSVESVSLTDDSGTGSQVSVPLPASEASAASVSVRLSFYLRLTRDDCEPPDNPALWVTISGASAIRFAEADPGTAPPLMSIESLFQRSAREAENTGPLFVMPDAPTAGELDAAGVLAYHFGRWLGEANQAPLLSQVQSSLPSADTAAIVVGQAASLPIGDEWGDLVWDGQQFVLNGAPVPAEHGVLAIRVQPMPQLLVSGATEAAVRLAAEALAQPLTDDIFAASAVVITGQRPAASTDRYAWQDGAASFAQLGLERRDVTGPGEHFIDLTFDRPAGWVLQDGGTLQLVLDVSPAVRADTSWIRAVVNGLDVGAQPVQPNDLSNARYVFNLPAGRLNNQIDGQPLRTLSLQIRIFLDYPESVCEVMDPQSVWASILPGSLWMLPHDNAPNGDVARFPAALDSGGTPATLLVAIPNDATGEETVAALQVLAAAGRWSGNQIPTRPLLGTAEYLSESAVASQPAILIGGPARNSLTADLDAENVMPDPPAVLSDLTQPYGSLSWLESAWSDGNSVLVVAGSGEQGQGTLIAAASLATRESLAGMQGSRIVVTDGPAPQQVAGAEPANSAPREFTPYIAEAERPWIERWPAWQVVGAILVIAFIALVVGVVTLRWIRGGTPRP